MLPCRNLHFPFLHRGEQDFTNSKLVKTQAFKVTLNFDLAPLCPPPLKKNPCPPMPVPEMIDRNIWVILLLQFSTTSLNCFYLIKLANSATQKINTALDRMSRFLALFQCVQSSFEKNKSKIRNTLPSRLGSDPGSSRPAGLGSKDNIPARSGRDMRDNWCLAEHVKRVRILNLFVFAPDEPKNSGLKVR